MFSTLQLLFSKVHSSTAWLCTTFFPRCVLCCWFCLIGGHHDRPHVWAFAGEANLTGSDSAQGSVQLIIYIGMFSLVYQLSFSSFNFSCFLWSLYAFISGYNLSFRQKGSQPLKDNLRWQGRVGKKICALDVHSDSKDKDATGLSKLPQFLIQRQASPKTVRFWSQLLHASHMLDNFLWGKSFSLYT